MTDNSTYTIFSRVMACEHAPDSVVYLVPPVTVTRYENLATGEVREVREWNATAGALIYNLRKEGTA